MQKNMFGVRTELIDSQSGVGLSTVEKLPPDRSLHYEVELTLLGLLELKYFSVKVAQTGRSHQK